MHPHRSHLWVLVGALALIGCADRIDPLRAVAPTGTKSPPVAFAGVGVPDCGFENGAACPLSEHIVRCDTGLSLDLNGTPFNLSDDTCVNDSRHLAGPQFRNTWAAWALGNQRELAVDEPINWVMHLSTHNAFNNPMDGYVADPNQIWSLSDQLDLGSRFLWLDLHWKSDAVRLCHSLLVCGLEQRRFAYGIQEIAAWLDMEENRDEIVMIDFEAYLDGHFEEVTNPLKAFLEDKLFVSADRIGQSWPSRRELLRMGKRVIIGARGDDSELGDDFGRRCGHPSLGIRSAERCGRPGRVQRADGEPRSPLRIAMPDDSAMCDSLQRKPGPALPNGGAPAIRGVELERGRPRHRW
jgi:hypothetical protein